jgi:hypothetical protein
MLDVSEMQVNLFTSTFGTKMPLSPHQSCIE